MFENFKNKLKLQLGVPSVIDCYRRLYQLGYTPHEIIDIGAHKGNWSSKVNEIYPNATFYMFEPINKYYKDLVMLSQKIGNDSIVYNYLLSSKTNENLNFYINDSVSSVLKEHYNSNNVYVENINSKALDDVVKLKSKMHY